MGSMALRKESALAAPVAPAGGNRPGSELSLVMPCVFMRWQECAEGSQCHLAAKITLWSLLLSAHTVITNVNRPGTVESQRQISAPTVLAEDTQELYPPLGPLDDSCDALHPEKDEDTPETWKHGPSGDGGGLVCVLFSLSGTITYVVVVSSVRLFTKLQAWELQGHWPCCSLYCLEPPPHIMLPPG